MKTLLITTVAILSLTRVVYAEYGWNADDPAREMRQFYEKQQMEQQRQEMLQLQRQQLQELQRQNQRQDPYGGFGQKGFDGFSSGW